MSVTGFWCSCCGQWHDEMPMAFGLNVPESLLGPVEGREKRVEMDDDICIIRGDTSVYLVRSRLEIPMIDGPEPFAYTVWVSLSEKNFDRMLDLWQTNGRESEPPYFGWLVNSIPNYPETASLKAHVHTRPVGRRPLIELEPTDHPLAVEQREGITMAWVQEIVERVLHSPTSNEE